MGVHLPSDIWLWKSVTRRTGALWESKTLLLKGHIQTHLLQDLVQRSRWLGSWTCTWDPLLLNEILHGCDIFHALRLPHPWCEFWLDCVSFLLILLWPFICILSIRKSVQLVFRSFSGIAVLCVVVWCVCGRKWAQALPTLLSWSGFPKM